MGLAVVEVPSSAGIARDVVFRLRCSEPSVCGRHTVPTECVGPGRWKGIVDIFIRMNYIGIER